MLAVSQKWMNSWRHEDARLNTCKCTYIYRRSVVYMCHTLFYEKYSTIHKNMLSASYQSIISHWKEYWFTMGNILQVRTIITGKGFLPFFFLSFTYSLILPFIKSADHILAIWAYKILLIQWCKLCDPLVLVPGCSQLGNVNLLFHDKNSKDGCLMGTLTQERLYKKKQTNIQVNVIQLNQLI